MLSAPNTGNLMNPWDNALRLQAEATQLAKIQLMQNLLQVISTNPLPNTKESNLLGSNFSPFEGILNVASTSYSNPNFTPPEFLNPVVTQQPPNEFQAIANSWECYEDGFSSEVLNINNNSLSNSYEIQTEKPLPELVSVSPECSGANQMESKINPNYISTQSPTSSIFEAWREFMDDETFGSDWKNILE